MEDVVLDLFNMSISAGWVILAVLVLRFLLRRAPKNISVILWGAVGFRLVCPFSLKSALSLIPSGQTLAPEAVYSPTPELTTGIPAVNEVVNPVFSESFAADVTASVNPLQIALTVAGYVWIAGVAAMALYGIISYALLRRKVAASVRLRENIWLSDHVPTPFILGWVRPKIYLPSGMREDLYEPVIAHEGAHIKRADHWIKLLGFVLLCVYWFHPLVWVAYILLCRDIELACDERVIRDMDAVQKKDYSEALLACGIRTHRIAACPLAFGEVGVKQRIKAVLNYKKPTLWIILAAVVAVSILAVCFLTDPELESVSLVDTSGFFIDVSDYKAPVDAQKYATPMIEVLRVQVPQYFGFSDFKGLEVYVWDENGTLWCGLMPGTNRHKSQGEIDELVGVPLSSMAKILATYENPKNTSLYVLGASEYWGEESQRIYDSPLELWLRGQLGLLEVSVVHDISSGTETMWISTRSMVLQYRNTDETAKSDQLGFFLTDEAIYDRGFNPSGLYRFGKISVFSLKNQGNERMIVTWGSGDGHLRIFELTEIKYI